MTMEEMIRHIVREENEKHLEDIKRLLESHLGDEVPTTISVKEAAAILGFGVNKTYEMVQQAEHTGFPHLRDGNRIRVPYQALLNWINDKARQVV